MRADLSIRESGLGRAESRKMNKSILGLAVLGLVVACAETPIVPGDDDLPRPRGFSPSIEEDRVRGARGERLTPREARSRVDRLTRNDDARTRRLDDEFDIASGESD